MQISDQELRAMIRGAIERHVGGHAPAVPAPSVPDASPAARRHASHALLVLDGQADGACVIEPAVRCDHCGYCKSLGH